MLQDQKMKRRMSPWGAGFGSGRSDPAAMASGPPDVMANQEPVEVVEECSGKKKSKFQTFKNFFVRKKKKEPSGDHAELKGSQSSDNISKTSENNTLSRSEKGKGSKVSLGSKALSHDSVFVSDSSEANEALGASQDSIHGKVKSLQLQLKQAIRLGSPPSLMCVKRTEDAGTMSEDDGLPCSPPEYTSSQAATNQAERNNSLNLAGGDSDKDQLSSRAVSPLVTVPGDFSQPASPFGCLDNSAAKHKLGLRHKACNRRKAANRLEIKSEEHNGMDGSLNISFPDSLEAPEEEEKRDASDDVLKQKPKEEKEAQEKEQPLLHEATEEDELDVSLDQDTSCHSGVVAADTQPSPSPELSNGGSSLDSPIATPEPPAGHQAFWDHSLVNGKEKGMDGLDLGEEDGLGEGVEGDGSFLQEVLSSLKTPLPSCTPCVATEDVVLDLNEENKEQENEEEVKDEPAFPQIAPCDTLLDQSSEEEEEEEEEVAALTSPFLHVDEEEESEDDDEKEEEEEEELVVERFSQPCIRLEDEHHDLPQEVKPEEQHDLYQTESNHREELETEASEEDQKLIDLQVEGEGHEVRADVEEEEKQQWTEVAEDEEWEMLPVETCQEVCNVTLLPEQRETSHVDTMGNSQCTHEVETLQESCDLVTNHESQMFPNGNDRESKAREEDEDFKHTELHSGEDEGKDRDVEQEELLEMEKETETKQTISFRLSSSSHFESPSQDTETLALSTPSTPGETDPPAETITPIVPCETVTLEETTICTESLPASETFPHAEVNIPTETFSNYQPPNTPVHTNLVSPCLESGTFAFQLSPSDEDPKVAASYTITEQHVDEEITDTGMEVKEEPVTPICDTDVVDEATPLPEEEVVNQLSERPNERKVRFTIIPAWQRSLSGGEPKEIPPPSSAPTPSQEPGDEDVEETTKKDPQLEAQMEKCVKTTVAGGTAVKAFNDVVQDPVTAQTSAAATKEESTVAMEGNNPFGIRLRKTAVLHRFGSEEENTEAPVEPPAQPVTCKVEMSSFKASISPPVFTKPVLPKKPDVHGETGVKSKRVSEPAAARGVPAESECPSWISMARQKQKIYKENSLEEITVKKEDQDSNSLLPSYVSQTSKKELCTKTSDFFGKVSSSEISKSSSTTENETRKPLSPVTPVPPQLPKCQPLPCPVTPKPTLPSVTSKPAPQAPSSQRSLSPPTPVPVTVKAPSSSNPPAVSKPPLEAKPAQSPSTTLTSPPFPSRINPPLTASRGPALSGPPTASQRGLPSPSLPQDEPPWMALAKKKAKAWSEMPQIVQ
ncbi:capping protein inhibiting regulator of actin dynamics isoform X3 [Syngnathus acus]|uniref:capping protein inhibiting regulator of actin dynamics isoform X3 n=2 Tax=Syngnathus acus TaxID=161584 RepID=UPI001885DDB5|nr:capping protein inhibiting regulator of actin dynamics isoform X3 [Syngnathus acus]